MSGSFVFADLKMSVESLKSQGNLPPSVSGNPGMSPDLCNQTLAIFGGCDSRILVFFSHMSKLR